MLLFSSFSRCDKVAKVAKKEPTTTTQPVHPLMLVFIVFREHIRPPREWKIKTVATSANLVSIRQNQETRMKVNALNVILMSSARYREETRLVKNVATERQQRVKVLVDAMPALLVNI